MKGESEDGPTAGLFRERNRSLNYVKLRKSVSKRFSTRPLRGILGALRVIASSCNVTLFDDRQSALHKISYVNGTRLDRVRRMFDEH